MNCYIAVRLTASQILHNSFKVKAQQAALLVQQRHPLLGMSIDRLAPPPTQQPGALALYKSNTPIDIEIRSSLLDKAWLEAVSSECLNWKDTRPGAAMCKIIALQREKEYVLYFAMTHAMFDGRSHKLSLTNFSNFSPTLMPYYQP